ncbi:hypothetical protein Cantr_06253 [Candida viswanathii]|uniref:Zn(2)-C6 fungal-type domain-containing protein n=1 Tax=Candida viswanathii TaxID=5486 RepID=A0A367XVV7_9ASCO|nr:hypothetical protein Cantr_06253 [Candida viswanathii]
MTSSASTKVVRCLSCRKLKIKCDQGKPSCEYCRHRNKKCVYPSKELIPVPKKSAVCTLPRTTLGGPFGNSVSNAEFGILNIFKEKYIYVMAFGSKTLIKYWHSEVTELVQQNLLLAKSYLTTGTLMILYLNDEEVLQEVSLVTDYSVDELKSTSYISVYGRSKLILKTITYFGEAINALMKYIAKAQDGELTEMESREVFASGVLLYGYMVYAYPLLTLVSFDDQVVDYLALALKFVIVEGMCVSPLARSLFRKYFMTSQDDVYLTSASSPIITDLQNQLYNLQLQGGAPEEEMYICSTALEILNSRMDSAIEMGSPLPIFNCIVSFSSDFCRLAHSKNEFALRLLFVYSCILVFCKYYIKRKSNMWMDYIAQYKTQEFLAHGKFRHQMDADLYYLATETKFVTRCNEFRNFHPAVYVARYKSTNFGCL